MWAMILQLRSFQAVTQEGSLHRAAKRLNVSQSALSRQMQALEHEVGGKLLERTSTGVRLTNGGHTLAAKAGAFLASYDAGMRAVRRVVRGESEQLRIGYVGSLAHDYLNPALAVLRRTHASTKLRLLDISPGEQITALRRGEIDVALTDQAGDLFSLDFFTRRLATVPSVVILSADHSLASRKQVRLADLKDETFVNGHESEMPGYNRRVSQLCRKLGKFRAKFVGQPHSLAEALELVKNDHAVWLMPDFMRHRARRGVSMVPVADPKATWDLFVVWQRGKTAEPLRTLLKALPIPP